MNTKGVLIRPQAGESVLTCPRCGSEYIHQANITAYQRGEDAEQVFKVAIDGNSAKAESVPSAGSGNPSARRQGLAIRFTCESCDCDNSPYLMELTISQHKGQTFLEWRGDVATKPKG